MKTQKLNELKVPNPKDRVVVEDYKPEQTRAQRDKEAEEKKASEEQEGENASVTN